MFFPGDQGVKINGFGEGGGVNGWSNPKGGGGRREKKNISHEFRPEYVADSSIEST